MNNSVQRYSDTDLEEFRVLVEKKLSRAREQLELLQNQILEVTENSDGDYGQDMMDDSNTNTDVEMLNSLAIHQRKYIRELENALGRIRNKTYGICEVSGELIDKKRLLAVPTTTKSLAAKLGVTPPPPKAAETPVVDDEEDEEKTERRAPRPQQRQVITKIIRKLPTRKSSDASVDDDDDFLPGDDDNWADVDDSDVDDNDDNDSGNEEVPFQDMDDFPDESTPY